jgi:hypothetical protein
MIADDSRKRMFWPSENDGNVDAVGTNGMLVVLMIMVDIRGSLLWFYED